MFELLVWGDWDCWFNLLVNKVEYQPLKNFIKPLESHLGPEPGTPPTPGENLLSAEMLVLNQPRNLAYWVGLLC